MGKSRLSVELVCLKCEEMISTFAYHIVPEETKEGPSPASFLERNLILGCWRAADDIQKRKLIISIISEQENCYFYKSLQGMHKYTQHVFALAVAESLLHLQLQEIKWTKKLQILL